VTINSDAIGKDVGGGIVLEIVIGVALPIRDGLRCHPQESTPLTVVDNVGSYAPPLIGIRAVFNRHEGCLHCRHCCGQRQGASNATAAAATVVIVVSRPRGSRTKDDAIVVIFNMFQEDDESSARPWEKHIAYLLEFYFSSNNYCFCCGRCNK
jgi:hypothetical protein